MHCIHRYFRNAVLVHRYFRNAVLDDIGRKQLSDEQLLDGEHSFGWSSPWPWDTGIIDEQPNYRILFVDENSAGILYYAWTSGPHVTVWHQVIVYQYAEEKEEIDGMRMDYTYGNGAGEALNRNALLNDNAKRIVTIRGSGMHIYCAFPGRE